MGIAAYQTKSEFCGKIDWEGGIEEALLYGLKSNDLADTPENAEFRDHWDQLEARFKEWRSHADSFSIRYSRYFPEAE